MVLIVRCGVGLLPLLCVRNGNAKKVIGLEQSACIEYARCVVKDNMYDDKITLIQSSVIKYFFIYLLLLHKNSHFLYNHDITTTHFNLFVYVGSRLKKIASWTGSG